MARRENIARGGGFANKIAKQKYQEPLSFAFGFTTSVKIFISRINKDDIFKPL